MVGWAQECGNKGERRGFELSLRLCMDKSRRKLVYARNVQSTVFEWFVVSFAGRHLDWGVIHRSLSLFSHFPFSLVSLIRTPMCEHIHNPRWWVSVFFGISMLSGWERHPKNNCKQRREGERNMSGKNSTSNVRSSSHHISKNVLAQNETLHV